MLLSGHFVFPTHDEEWGHNRSKLLDLYKTFLVPKIEQVKVKMLEVLTQFIYVKKC